jgi:hypothetical protein
MVFEEQYDLEIVEQSTLDHFNFVLQKAQELAAEAEKKKPRKHPKRYNGKSKKTLKRRKKIKENLAKQGYLSVFEFMTHVEETVKKRECIKQLVARAAEGEQESEESAPESASELDTEDLVSKRVGQVRRKELLMH